jgi:hypothetical protein
MYVNFGPSATLAGSTITGNTAGAGGGIYLDSGTVTLQDSTVSGNVPDNCAPPGSVTGCTGYVAAAAASDRQSARDWQEAARVAGQEEITEMT